MTRKAAFILAATDHGTMIVNRFDFRNIGHTSYGVGFQLLDKCSYDAKEGGFVMQLLDLRRQYIGPGVTAIDCGANIGVHTVSWAKGMTDWGTIIGIEAQERLFYALAGNIVINNCHNARAIYAALGSENGTMDIPTPNYCREGSFGSLELRKNNKTEYIGQLIDYTSSLTTVPMITIDSLNLSRLDLIKIDVEGMEMDVLEGAIKMLEMHHPIIVVERIKTAQTNIEKFLTSFGYKWFDFDMNLLAVHPDDQVTNNIQPNTESLNDSSSH